MKIDPTWEGVAELVAAKVADRLRAAPPTVVPEWISEKDAARLLGISAFALADYRRRGCGPEHAVLGDGKLVRYRVEALRRWAEERIAK